MAKRHTDRRPASRRDRRSADARVEVLTLEELDELLSRIFAEALAPMADGPGSELLPRPVLH
jgi:hypothetical protein